MSCGHGFQSFQEPVARPSCFSNVEELPVEKSMLGSLISVVYDLILWRKAREPMPHPHLPQTLQLHWICWVIRPTGQGSLYHGLD